MLSLQRDIRYAGDIDTTPADKITLAALFPRFTYALEGDESGVNLIRTVKEPLTVAIDHALAESCYGIDVPVSALAGATHESASYFLSYIVNTAIEMRRLDELRLDIPMQFLLDSQVFGTTTVRAIYWVRQLYHVQELVEKLAGESANPDSNAASDSTRLKELIGKHLLLLNAEVFEQLYETLQQLTQSGFRSPHDLLKIIEVILDQTEYTPSSVRPLSKEQREKVEYELIRSYSSHLVGPALDVLEKQLPDLFNFPLEIPQISVLNVAGTFQILAGGATVTKRDLKRYTLSYQYVGIDVNQESAVKRVTYEWGAEAEPQDDQLVPFAFSPVILNAMEQQVVVEVKAFDGSTVWHRAFALNDPELQALKIAVELVRPTQLERPATSQDAQLKRLRGQTLMLNDQCPLKGLTVVVEAKDTLEGVWRVVTAGTTDASGSFSLPYPYGVFVAAQARVSLSPQTPAAIPIRSNGQENETIADDFLYLLITDPVCPDEASDKASCDCDAPVNAPRLPDQSDLINSDEYTQDIGGACVNLSTPNRTLSEYSYHAIVRTSDPDVANYELIKNHQTGGFQLQIQSSSKASARGSVSLDNPIRWQDAPSAGADLSLYQAVTVATGHVLYYKAEFKADGYSLGDLLYSLGLAPGQKKQVVVIDSAHQLHGAESQVVSQDESLAASLVAERDITDQIAGGIGESMSGRSSSNTSGFSAGLGASGGLGSFISGALGVSGGTASADASASQNSSRTTSAFFGEKLRQSLMQNAQGYRQLNATVVTSVKEGQQYSVNTEVVANHNHCHALTMMYFEVLRHFAIYQKLVNVEECIFVPLLMTDFSPQNIYKWRDVLASHLLPIPSNTYIRPFAFLRSRVTHPLIPAFDANERIETDYKFVDFPAGAYCDEPITSLSGSLTLRVNIPRPKTIYDRILSFPITERKKTVDDKRNGGGLFGWLGDQLVGDTQTTTTWEEKEKVVDQHIRVYDNFQRARPADVIEVISFDNLFENGSKDGLLWDAIAALCGYSADVPGFMRNYFSNQTISQWDKVFNQEIAPVVFQALIDGAISIWPFGAVDFTPTTRYHGGERIMRLNLHSSTSLARKAIGEIRVTYEKSIPAASKTLFWQAVTLNLETINIRYTTAHYEGYIVNKSVRTDLYDNDAGQPHAIQTPMNRDEQKSPRTEDKYLVRRLLEHLNSNLEHYNKVLWHRLDPDRRYMLLDGFTIQVFNSLGEPLPAPRSLASVVKNELLTVAGNSLVLPVAAGYRVSESYVSEVDETGVASKVSLLDHYQPLTPVPPYRISVPTRGVFLEAVQGACDACEKIKPNSSQDWTKFTTDEPTSILPVTTPVPTITDWKAAFKDFASPMINIQNAPATPAPGAGLASVQELLGKSDVFKDITGLDATQQNVLKTYLSNQDNAKAFAAMAKDMAMQQHNTEHSDQIMDSLNEAYRSGALSKEEHGKLTKQHHQQMLDGGENQRTESQPQKTPQKPTLVDAAVTASYAGKSVKATSMDPEGNAASIDIRGEGAQIPVLAEIPGSLKKIKQPNPMACWATTATMMVNWKLRTQHSVAEVMAIAGQVYLDKFNDSEPLFAEEKDDFLSTLKLVGEPPANFPPQKYIDWIKQYGPLWITTDASLPTDSFSPHARILYRIEGSNTTGGSGMYFVFVDPATGTAVRETFAEFIAAFEAMVSENPDDLFIQIVHFSEPVRRGGEGGGGGAQVPGSGSDSDSETSKPWSEGETYSVRSTEARLRDPENEFAAIKEDGKYKTVAKETRVKLGQGHKYGNKDWVVEMFSQSEEQSQSLGWTLLSNLAKVHTCAEYKPTEKNCLIVNEKEFIGVGVPAVTNWSSENVLHFTLSEPQCRNVKDVDEIIIHESVTSDWTINRQKGFKYSVHLAILEDGDIYQHLDLVQRAEHAGPHNNRSIAIEIINNPVPSAAKDATQVTDEYLGTTTWAHGKTLADGTKPLTYMLPTQAQMESLYTLVTWLVTENMTHEHNLSIPLKWPAITDQHYLFYWYEKYRGKEVKTEKIVDGKKKMVTSFLKPKEKPTGICAHGTIGGSGSHVDGHFPVLYLWLRISANGGEGMDHETAWERAKILARAKPKPKTPEDVTEGTTWKTLDADLPSETRPVTDLSADW